jgi:hypothetical protein
MGCRSQLFKWKVDHLEQNLATCFASWEAAMNQTDEFEDCLRVDTRLMWINLELRFELSVSTGLM